MKYLVAALGFAAFVSAASAETLQSFAAPAPVEPTVIERVLQLGGAEELSQTCCKRCNKGKACGNSCISKSYTCRKGQGCACN